MSLFGLDVSRKRGMATLLIAARGTHYDFKHIFAWPSTEGIRKFAEVLLEMYHTTEEKRSSHCGFLDASTHHSICQIVNNSY